jgi:hypothetical protein
MEAVGTFTWEWAFAVGLIFAFGACGIGFLTPFVANPRVIYFSAPLVGLLVVTFGANALYTLLRFEYAYSALTAAACCLALTALRLVMARPSLDRRTILAGLVGLFVISAFAVVTNDFATIKLHGPAVFFMDGTDHAGYSHLADWLNLHGIGSGPAESPDRPYESWPAYMFAYDPRFGSFGLLAIIARLHGTSGIFSYDVACAIVITATALGVAAVFGRSLGLVFFLALGLLVSHWFDYAHGGYFGKLIAYPAMLFVCGLTLNYLRSPSFEQLSMLMILSAAVGTMHSGAATTFLLAFVFGVALVAIAIWRDEHTQISTAAFLCGLVAAMPLIASGVLARPLNIGFPDYKLPWSYIVPRILDLESQGVALSGLSPAWLQAQVAVALAAWSGLLALAVHCRNACATGLLGGSAILLIGTMATGAGGVAFQLIGYFYPAVICGAVALVADGRTARAIALAVAVLTIAQRVPRFIGATDRYAFHQNEQYRFSASEIDRLADEIGSQTVQIDVDVPPPAILLLIELGARQLGLQWSQRGWDTVLGYRGWPLPVWTNPPTMTLGFVYGGGAFNHFALVRPLDH